MAYPIYGTPGILPSQSPDMGGLLGNGALQMGLGILANNTGNYGAFGPALGRGLQQGFSAMQQAEQLANLRKLQSLQFKKADKEDQDLQRQLEAVRKFKEQFPELATAIDIDPKSALKAAYPKIGQSASDPYYQFIPTEQGIVSGNARTGELNVVMGPDGKPYIKSSDSPMVRGQVKSAESQAAAAFKPNTDINGIVSTDEQVARGAYGNNPMPFSGGMPTNNFSTPYPVTFGAPGTTSTDRAEGTMTDGSVAVRNPANPNVGGIRVPTQAQLAADKKQAEMRAESTTKKEITMAGVGDVIDQAKSLLTGDIKPTGSLFGNIYDQVAGAVGATPQGASQADELKVLGGKLVSLMPRMEGPQSNYDVQNYKEMAGDVGNPNLPVERRLAALTRMESIVRKYDKQSGQPNAEKPPAKNALPLPAKPSALNLKKGTRYATPMGDLIWNGKAFED